MVEQKPQEGEQPRSGIEFVIRPEEWPSFNLKHPLQLKLLRADGQKFTNKELTDLQHDILITLKDYLNSFTCPTDNPDTEHEKK